MGTEATSPKPLTGDHAERWQLVRTWKMRGEPKLAWWYLYFEAAGGRCTTLHIHPSTLAAYQGVDTRSGVRALESLESHGFIEVVDKGGIWIIYLADPLVVVKGRRAHEGDGQGELFETLEQPADELKYSAAGIRPDDTAERGVLSLQQLIDQKRQQHAREHGAPRPEPVRAADVAQHPPQQPPVSADVAQPSNLQRDNISLKTFQPSKHYKSLHTERRLNSRRGGSGATSAVLSADVQQLSAIVDRAAQLAGSPADQAAAVQELATWIQHQVDDPDLFIGPCLKAAAAICAGEYSIHHLLGVLAALRKAIANGTLRGPKWKYVVYALQRSMQHHARALR